MTKLEKCPICGAKAAVKKDAPDGNFMGFSVGCPRYREKDGIHPMRCSFSCIDTEEKAVKKWNEYTGRLRKGMVKF